MSRSIHDATRRPARRTCRVRRTRS